jgi:hypothetical protein
MATEKSLPIPGQCVFMYTMKKNEKTSFYFANKEKTNILHVEIKNEKLYVSLSTQLFMIAIPLQSNIIKHTAIPYWFSLDSQNYKLYAGIGEPRLETSNYCYIFDSHDYKKILESLITVHYHNESIECLKLVKDPVTNNVPLLVKDTDDLSMEDIAKSVYMPKANLSSISQKMYDCISGKKFVLNTPDFPDFTDAIEHSIITPGCWCNTTLKHKSTEFNPDKPNLKETYLRITLGENNGESPGVPYVMEIWPIGHFSPVHSHANAEAVIRVLHGTIHVKLFPYLSHNKEQTVKPFGYADFKENDITWISPTLNQTHQLFNKESSTQTCITIQCYMYNQKDKSHYDYFDYIDANGHVEPYEPDTDMNFVSFKELMKQEWSQKK